jgi:Kef-type K+ transport system membrane component KefB
MLMFNAGMNVPLSDPGIRSSLARGSVAAALTAALAVLAGIIVALLPGVGHPAVYAVLIASGSAAIVVPVIQERGLRGNGIFTLITQVTVADIAATIAIPFVLRPSAAGHAALGTAATAACVIAAFLASRLLRRSPRVQALRKEGKHRNWAIDLRAALLALFVLAWVAESTGASVLIAGFGAGLMAAAMGGPKRLSTQVLGVAGGFFIPLFFVVLGASVELRGVVQHPAMIALTCLLVLSTVVVHEITSLVTGQRLASGLVASAQLGVPSAIVALGLSEHVISATQGAAIITAAMATIAICSLGAANIAEQTPPPPHTRQDPGQVAN